MPRSVWKGPFVDGYLLEESRRRAFVGPLGSDQDLEPPLDDPAAIRRAHLRRPQRPEAHPGLRHRGHGRPQVRRVLADPDLPEPFGGRRSHGEERGCCTQGGTRRRCACGALLLRARRARGSRWARPHEHACSRTTRRKRSRACCACRRRSSASSRGLIRGKKVATALADLRVLEEAHLARCEKCLQSAIANAENNHDLDVDDLVVAEAHVGKAFVIKRWTPRGRGKSGRIFRTFSNITIIVREQEQKQEQKREQKGKA